MPYPFALSVYGGANDGVFCLLSDHLNSSSAIVNQSGDTLTNNYYYPYGGNRGGAFSNLTTKRFTGQYHESSLPGGEGVSYDNVRASEQRLKVGAAEHCDLKSV